MFVGRLVGWSVGWSVGNAFVRRSTRRTLLAYLALFLNEMNTASKNFEQMLFHFGGYYDLKEK